MHNEKGKRGNMRKGRTEDEVPDREGVKVHHICTVMLNGYPGMRHIINDCGGAVAYAVEREIICEYEAGIVK